jgi:hypothetical protein
MDMSGRGGERRSGSHAGEIGGRLSARYSGGTARVADGADGHVRPFLKLGLASCTR